MSRQAYDEKITAIHIDGVGYCALANVVHNELHYTIVPFDTLSIILYTRKRYRNTGRLDLLDDVHLLNGC